MSVLYLAFETDQRQNRLLKLQKSGAHIVVSEPRWPGFFELAKREKPFAIAIDLSFPLHALETAEYLSKARETKDAALFLVRVPADRREAVQKRLPQAVILTENELSARLAQMEQEAEARARAKKEAAAAAKKAARAAARAGMPEKGKPVAAIKGKLVAAVKGKPAPAVKGKAAPKAKPAPALKKKAAKKPAAPARKPQPKKKK